jgi:hypothetical protein
MNENRREVLEDYLDRRVAVNGVFDKFSNVYKSIRTIRTALLQDSEFEAEGKNFDIGHVYVQNAEVFRSHDLLQGDRVRCVCRVVTYKKYLRVPNDDGLMVVQKFTLAWPSDVEILYRVPREPQPALTPALVEKKVETAPASQIGGAADPVGLLLEVKELAKEAGGWEPLLALAKPEAQAIMARLNLLSGRAGGLDRFMALAEAMKQ